ncbi:MAG TPA: GMC family oxidoreductase [Miltoncostaeaceae bacterium]|nr:GMC family oxidoreductase [Miltoncostaeaceae bacterium]
MSRPGRYDVLVLGGGTAGCVLAARLSEDPGTSVCLVEAGPDYGPRDGGRWPAEMLDARILPLASHAWEKLDPDDRSQSRARIIGGCSSHNACVVLEGTPEDYDEWGPGWRYAEIAPYLDRAGRALGTRTFAPEELSPWHAAFAEAAGEDAIIHPVNADGAVRLNAAFAYLDPARGRPNLTILGDTVADRVLLDGDRATGALTSAGEIRAGVVVLASGAYGSPGVLLRSGIGPEQGLPVGQNLIDHVGVGIGWVATDRLQEETARFEARHPAFMGQVSVRGRSSICEEGTWDTFLFPALDPGYVISAAVFSMKPRSTGRVGLSGPEPEAPLAIDHGFFSDPSDVDVVTEAFEAIRELARSGPVAPYAAREHHPGAEVGAREHVLAAHRGFFHPVGTCAIGSVVDEAGRVHGIEGLRVADASVMPTIPRVNTNLSTAAVAERVAELVLADR